ncbi:sialoadhesin-like isoform X2 [Cyprinus carpio]|uniref:Sialoadhesin-like isoform X1 n=1 Tax=Cyprinus carpio TaxID=7962 RepID=A0A9Q9YHC6_CYPCA|nr:sialoadhesin-like isoform X1 [Cyprinus carpio]XP_042620232.1 sialoadhesin-like isoform X2 [Cyprinus carpio]
MHIQEEDFFTADSFVKTVTDTLSCRYFCHLGVDAETFTLQHEISMATSLIRSLPLIFVIMTAGGDGQQDWGVNYSPSYVCALKGSTVKISCVLNYPHDLEVRTVFWTKPTVTDGDPPNLCLDSENRGRVQCDRENNNTYSITLTDVTEADKHIYYCRFTTNRGTWTGIPGAHLDVTDLQVETQQSVKEGESVTLTCNSSCSLPQQTFIWFRNTQRLTTGIMKVNQLQLESVSRNDAGNYQCAVSGYEPLISPPVNLKVEWDDGQQDWGVNYSPSYVCALKGSTVKISCTLKYPSGNKIETVFWTKPAVPDGDPPKLCLVPENRGRVQCDRENNNTYSITLTNVTEADKHIYYCRFITNTESGKWTGIPGAQLDVTDLQVETQQSVKEGDSVTLTCNSSCSLPQQTFIWFRNTQRLTTGIITENQLQLQSVSRQDGGNYQCAVSGYEHLISPPVYLNIEYPPKSVSVSISPSGVIVEGDSVTLSCSSDSNPPGDFTWFKGGQYAGSRRIYSVSNISSDHSGEYKCRSRNKHGLRYSDVVILNVMYAPRNVVVALNSSAEIVEGDSVTLNCSSDSNPPALIFSWFKENQSSAVGSGQSFSISSFNSSHSGRFYCEAQNKHGSQRSESVSVTVKGTQRAALQTVTGIVAGLIFIVIIIIIIIVFISRKRQRECGTEDLNQKQTADSSDDTYTALDPVSRTSADIYSTIRSGDSRAPNDTYTALDLQSRSSDYETLAVTSADPH